MFVRELGYRCCMVVVSLCCGIFGVEVKFVDIGRNIRGEGDPLGHY